MDLPDQAIPRDAFVGRRVEPRVVGGIAGTREQRPGRPFSGVAEIAAELLIGEARVVLLPAAGASSQMRSDLDKLSKRDGVSRSDIVRECVRDYLFVRRFRSMRKSMVSKASANGVYTDEDVFDLVS